MGFFIPFLIFWIAFGVCFYSPDSGFVFSLLFVFLVYDSLYSGFIFLFDKVFCLRRRRIRTGRGPYVSTAKGFPL